jgi:hypothetical protein
MNETFTPIPPPAVPPKKKPSIFLVNFIIFLIYFSIGLIFPIYGYFLTAFAYLIHAAVLVIISILEGIRGSVKGIDTKARDYFGTAILLCLIGFGACTVSLSYVIGR